MAIIAIVDADTDDQKFFAFKLSDHDLIFYDAPVEDQLIDPSTEILSILYRFQGGLKSD